MRRILLSLLAFLLVIPASVSAAAKPLEVAGWIPYWRAATGTTDVLPHMKTFSAIMPFGYIVQNDGSLHDAFDLSTTSPTSAALIASAKAAKTRVIPTVMWSNGVAIHSILSSGPARRALEDSIANLVMENGFDGIDIDFENKYAKTKPYFSLFLQGLYARMGKKFVYCSIEARTPPSAAFDVIPTDLTYANDFRAINKYCDRVELMTYDQGTIDLRLNSAANSAPYIPISDPKWVQKVVNLTAQTIPKNKILIGVPTYGYEYDLVPITQGYRYNIDWAFNPRYATELASELGVMPTRNSAGEMSFVYTPTTTPSTATSTSLRIVWWSDAQAIQDKLKLAKSLGVRGIAIFKLDGGEDPNLWNILPTKH
jgi:spore germination protein